MGTAPVSLDGLQTPALLLDLDIMEANVAAMAKRLRDRGIALRPHAKTHKSAQVARCQLDHGAAGLTVATIGEAEAFARRRRGRAGCGRRAPTYGSSPAAAV